MNFTDKVVLVTGASAGIGEATAILLAKHGARLSLVGRNEKCLRDVAARCEKERGHKPLAIIADLGTDEGCERTAKETLDYFGRLDVLVNNAGVGVKSTIEDADMKMFDDIFAVNIRGVYNLTRLLVPALTLTKGNIVNVSSVAATCQNPGLLTYGMAKAALDHFTRLIALELAPKGVRVNTVSPGLTKTKIFERLQISVEERNDFEESFRKKIPMGRVCEPEHIAKMIFFLASDDSELVTGTTVQVDGGLALA